ncbi:uncharacterized protein LOC124129118 [Haliotis rufescens]|uniref:uncharacterized protein LOC124129118 n=1 Tax=Haliotis rufescens TaxID=6454 RepID=UPI00201EDD84|nr:uncharacterized protein LOC124129118 [Haliotis rufescens]
MDRLCTFTAYLVLVTCIATSCTAKSQRMSWETDFNGYRIHIYGTMKTSGTVKIIHVNVTILAETTIANLCSSTKCNKNQSVPLQPELKAITSDKLSVKYVCQQNCNMTKAFYRATYNVQNHRTYHIAKIKVTFTYVV